MEFHGYHAKQWRPIPVTLPSQRYDFWLVERAIDRGATIAVMRGERVWEVAVPRLRGYRPRDRGAPLLGVATGGILQIETR